MLVILHATVPTAIENTGFELEPTVTENRTLILDCPAIGLPIPIIQWLKNGEPLDLEDNPHMYLKLDGRKLVIKSAMVEDTGAYECRATNEAGTDQLNYDIEVWGETSGHVYISSKCETNASNVKLYIAICNLFSFVHVSFSVPPFIDLEQSTGLNPQVIVNQTAIISCFAIGIPSPTIKWLVNGQPLVTTGSQQYRLLSDGRQLEIFKAEVPDSARYTCIASNEAGVADRDFDLDVHGRPIYI